MCKKIIGKFLCIYNIPLTPIWDRYRLDVSQKLNDWQNNII